MQLTAADLFVRIDREFRRRKPRECPICAVPLPFRVDGADGQGPNWEIVPPPECPRGCALVLEEIIRQHRAHYELASDNARDD